MGQLKSEQGYLLSLGHQLAVLGPDYVTSCAGLTYGSGGDGLIVSTNI